MENKKKKNTHSGELHTCIKRPVQIFKASPSQISLTGTFYKYIYHSPVTYQDLRG